MEGECRDADQRRPAVAAGHRVEQKSRDQEQQDDRETMDDRYGHLASSERPQCGFRPCHAERIELRGVAALVMSHPAEALTVQE
jgi:hypothetical protein